MFFIKKQQQQHTNNTECTWQWQNGRLSLSVSMALWFKPGGKNN